MIRVRALLLAGTIALPCAGQIAPRTRPSPERPSSSLKASLGIERARALLRSEASGDRLRAFERLGAIGSEGAIELLARALDAGGAARDGRERLAATRALARHGKAAMARSALVRALGAPASPERADPLLGLARDTAAIGLARSADPAALGALGQALRQPGRSAEAALGGLVAYPPRDVNPVLRARGAVTTTLVEFLEQLADPRANALLHEIARRGSPEVRARALSSLAIRGDREVLAVILRSWKGEPHPALRAAGAEVLARYRSPEAPAALAQLFDAGKTDPAAFERAIEIALVAPAPSFVAVLEQAMKSASPEQRERIVSALGRASGERAVAALARWLGDRERASAAAFALAHDPSEAASDALARALTARGPARRYALRAAAVRSARLGEAPAGTEEAWATLASSAEPADRAAAAFALALLDPDAGSALFDAKDPVLVRAAARSALEGALALAAATRLTREKDPVTRAALALCLADDRAADTVPNAVLEGLLTSSPAAAPLAARALAQRDGATLRPRIERLLAGPDVRLRAHAALGLARSEEPSAVGLLDRAYEDEIDPRVRRAIVLALAQRSEPGRRRTLTLAAELEPDPEARGYARRALAGKPPLSGARSVATAWARIDDPSRRRFLWVEPPGGPTLPAAPDPDGFAAVSGLPEGALLLQLANASFEGQESVQRPP